MRPAASVIAFALAASGCTYYNAMWSAERFAKDARRLEAHGREPEARTQWARAAVKAESVFVHHPRSKWADDALVLRAEGLALAGTCDAAAVPLAKALSTVSEVPLRERAGLAAAHCALRNGKTTDAERALTEPLASTDAGRRSRAEYLAGQGAASRYDYDAAVAHFERSREPKALPARVRVLLTAGRAAAAAAVLDTLAMGRFVADDWTDLLDQLAGVGGPEAASRALERMLARTRVPSGDRARLLVADGDRRLARGDVDFAAARYEQAAASLPAAQGGVARVRGVRVLAARAASPADLSVVIAALTHLARSEKEGGLGGGAGAAEAQTLLDLVVRVSATSGTLGETFRAAELARDSLKAPRLAGQLFVDLAATDSGSLFAPKALVAALVLLPDRHDSIVGVLDRRYAASPYTRAFRGEASLAYAALEDSLARELGIEVARIVPSSATRARSWTLLTGPRGPWLDDAPSRAVAAPLPGGRRPQEGVPGRRTPSERPVRERPVVPPASS
ncbi:MAG TPA: hypothetical protein VGQ18_05805 [Gemmatimonadales bacterium]|jgi:hypothetical protein|nr:hypothetical protein [Gemmatimonadales bacterium]